MKYKDYKGKFNILIDFDDIEKAKEYVYYNYNSSRHYGVPVYSGKDKELNKLVEMLHKVYDYAFDMKEKRIETSN